MFESKFTPRRTKVLCINFVKSGCGQVFDIAKGKNKEEGKNFKGLVLAPDA